MSTRRPRIAAAAAAVVAVSIASAPARGQDGTEIQKCDKPVGTIAVNEPQNDVMMALRRYNLQSPTQLIRMMIQQSNCFQVVERGVAMQNIMQERSLSQSGELQQGQNMGKGQMRTADYVMTASVLFSENNAGGVGGALGGLGRRVGGIAAVAGGLKFKEAQTTMTIADARSTVQVAAAQGQAKKKDFALGAFGWLGGVAGAAGGYTNTNEGKVIAASFVDNYNQIVASVKSNPDMQRAAAGDASAKGDGVQAAMSFNNGDVLAPKIDNVKLLATASATAKVMATLKKTDEVVFMGQEQGGYLKVQGGAGEGWVSKVLLVKR
jgi:hypothetical protein